jgi:3-oxoacyl-[acyl-carrier protein] reductase
MTDDLSGQVAVITGAGRGIGRIIARELAREGAAVALVARSEDQLAQAAVEIATLGGRVLTVAADVSDPLSAGPVISRVAGELGPIDLLVNNAAVVSPFGPLWEVDADEWWRTLEINLRGPFLYSRAVLPAMIDRRRGRIVVLSSAAAAIRPSPPSFMSAYILSKTALPRFAELLASEVQEHGIQTFVVDPGPVATEMTDYMLHSADGQQWGALGWPWARALADEGRFVPPELAARLVTLIATGRADALSGCYIDAREDVAALINSAEEIRTQNRRKLGLRM